MPHRGGEVHSIPRYIYYVSTNHACCCKKNLRSVYELIDYDSIERDDLKLRFSVHLSAIPSRHTLLLVVPIIV